MSQYFVDISSLVLLDAELLRVSSLSGLVLDRTGRTLPQACSVIIVFMSDRGLMDRTDNKICVCFADGEENHTHHLTHLMLMCHYQSYDLKLLL